MMSGDLILQLSDQAAYRAARERREPLTIWPQNVARDIAHAPFLGDFVPAGWRLARPGEFPELDKATWGWGRADDGDLAVCVDNSGFGSPSEPAHSLNQFAALVRACSVRAVDAGKEVGVAIRQAGQFQVYASIYVRDESATQADGEPPAECQECGQDTAYAEFDGDLLGGDYGTCGFCGQPVAECERCGERDKGKLSESDSGWICLECVGS